jgi:hypothetical protein
MQSADGVTRLSLPGKRGLLGRTRPLKGERVPKLRICCADLAACTVLALAAASSSRADLPAVPDRMAWVTVPDHSKTSMTYAVLHLANAARRHGMHCADVVAGAILRCDIDLGAGGSFIAGATENGYSIQLYFGETDLSGQTKGQAVLSAVLADYARSMRGSKTIGEVIRCRFPLSWTHDAAGASICERQ